MYIKKVSAIVFLLAFFVLGLFSFIQHNKVKSYERNMATIASDFSLIVLLINNIETEVDKVVSDSSSTRETDFTYIENNLVRIDGMTDPTLAALESLYGVEVGFIAGELRKITDLITIISEEKELSEQEEKSIQQRLAKMEQIVKYFPDEIRQKNGYYLEKENVKKQFEKYNNSILESK